MSDVTIPSRYDAMVESPEKDIDGETYPDPLSVDYTQFVYSEPPTILPVEDYYISKLYVKTYQFYGTAYWDDIILNLNSIPHMSKLVSTQSLKFPILQDMNKFIREGQPS